EWSSSGGGFELVLAHAADRDRGDHAAAAVPFAAILVSRIVALEREMGQPGVAHRRAPGLYRRAFAHHHEPGGLDSQRPRAPAPARHVFERVGGSVVL